MENNFICKSQQDKLGDCRALIESPFKVLVLLLGSKSNVEREIKSGLLLWPKCWWCLKVNCLKAVTTPCPILREQSTNLVRDHSRLILSTVFHCVSACNCLLQFVSINKKSNVSQEISKLFKVAIKLCHTCDIYLHSKMWQCHELVLNPNKLHSFKTTYLPRRRI